MGLIIILLFALVVRILKRSERAMLALNIYKAAALVSVPIVFIYSLIAGGGFSIVRAAVMGGTALAALLIDRRRDIPNLIAFAAFLILAFEPAALFDISFQLSFASVISLIVIFPYLTRIFERKEDGNECLLENSAGSRIRSHMAALALVSIAAAVGTAPLVAWYFNRVSLVSPIANLMTVPVVGFIIVPVGLLSSILIPVSGTVSGWLISANSFLISMVVKLTGLLASIPGASMRVVTPGLLEIGLFYCIVGLIVYRKDSRWAGRLIIPAVALLIGVESYFLLYPLFQKKLKVTFLDVGQAESTLVEFPGGKRMLIDGGGSPNPDSDIGERVVAPFLWRNRISRIDYLVLSHPNSDHYGGLPFIVRNVNVGEVWESGIEDKSNGYADFKRALRERGLVSKKVGEGDILSLDKTEIMVMSPPKGYLPASDREANNGSLVLKIKYGSTSFLFTGDIEKEAEERLLSKGSLLESTVLKVPHHGSLTSSSEQFLDRVRPKNAVFSVGYNNRFGFPKGPVVERYKKIRSELFRTDRDGAVTASSDGAKAILSKTVISD